MDKKYLFKRHKTWWVKVAVPRTLRAKLGFDLRESLKTQDLEKAQKLKWKIVEKLKNKIKEAKDESLKNRNKINDFLNDGPMKPTDTSDPQYYHKVVDCQYACPAHTPVPEYIRQIAQGNYRSEERRVGKECER